MSRYDEIPGLELDYSREWSELTSDAVEAYFQVTQFAIHEIARAERMKATAILGWVMAVTVWIPLLWSVIHGVKP